MRQKQIFKHLIRKDFIGELETEFSRNTAEVQENFRRFLKSDRYNYWGMHDLRRIINPMMINPIKLCVCRDGAISFPEIANSVATYFNKNGGKGYTEREAHYHYLSGNQKLKDLLRDKGILSIQICGLYNSWYEKITLPEGIKHSNGIYIRDWEKNSDAISRAISYMKKELATRVVEITQKLPEVIKYLHTFNHDGIEINLPEYAVDDFTRTPYAMITNLLPDLDSIIGAVESVVTQRENLTRKQDEIVTGIYCKRNINVQLRYTQENKAVVSQISLRA